MMPAKGEAWTDDSNQNENRAKPTKSRDAKPSFSRSATQIGSIVNRLLKKPVSSTPC
jgi:hypothetical protein